MKNKTINLLIFLIFIPFILIGQTKVTIFDENVNPSDLLDEIPLKPAEVKGSSYYFDEWLAADVKLKSGLEIKNYFIRYDLAFSRLEIRIDKNIKILNTQKIDRVILYGSNIEFSNVDNFQGSEQYLGLFEIVFSGQAELLKYRQTEIVKANYVPAMDVGRQFDKIIKKDKFYLSIDNKVEQITGKKKKDINLFKDHVNEVSAFLKKENISFKKEADLLKLVAYYNALL